MIVFINGPCGIGKTTVAWELISFFDRAVMLDGDHIGAVHPFEIYDDARITYLHKTIHNLIAFHIEEGDYHNFVLAEVFETPEEMARLRRLLSDLDDEIYAFRLTASDKTIAERIRRRDWASAEEREWHLRRYKELVAIQEEAAKRGDMGFVIDTTNRSAAEVAKAIWENLRESVALVPYDPTWPRAFEEERARLAAALGKLALEIHHVGSTAVPGMEAKPIIDITVAVRRLEDAVSCIAPLRELGYSFIDYPQNTTRRFFRKGEPRTHHLHIVAEDSQWLADHLDFRDALRANLELRQHYQELKRSLSTTYKNERAKYSELKGNLIAKALSEWRARK